MIICGHRGLAGLAPENTLAGLYAAYEAGLSWVEIDVQLSQDHQVVVFHDKRLERCTNGQGYLHQSSWRKLSTLDAGYRFSEAFVGEPIPLLRDYLAKAQQLNLGVNIELKLYSDQAIAPLCAAVSQIINPLLALGLWRPEKLLLSSFSVPALATLSRLAPKAWRALLVERIPHTWAQQLHSLGTHILHCQHNKLTHAQARPLIEAGYRLSCYTVNNQARAELLASWGVHMIFCDVPLTSPNRVTNNT
ncbi:glycerophosphodiester phosphodiesterase family protein [Oceanisphaera avium]|uniref:GP-PDE domain-containing protein n=1 Tax=Oceanisphaera avium TaxID=1903694 RepID=A0A1Y0D0A5_9GAMM|nr:glycerophosphodiester phosphodiesterase family protein [Oceanisphaera avium]ART81009.1 hypothetical protein CBP12_13295 [Oceanisphaera avium]